MAWRSKNNIKGLWWKRFVDDREDMYGVDAAILMNQKTWEASGHMSAASPIRWSNARNASIVSAPIN